MIYHFTGNYEFAPENDRNFYFRKVSFEKNIMAKTDDMAKKKLQIQIVSEIKDPIKKLSLDYTYYKSEN